MAAVRARTVVTAAIAAAGLAAVVAVRREADRIAARPGTSLQSIDLGPKRTHIITTHDGATLHVHEFGDPDAPPVVLAHGMVLRWWVWNGVIARLAPDHRVIAYDLRGHGDSTLGSDGLTVEACAADLAAVIDHLGVRGVTVAGYSMGGMALGRLLVDVPPVAERITAAVFVATAGGTPSFGGPDRRTPSRRRLPAELFDLIVRTPGIDFVRRPGAMARVALARVSFGDRPSAAEIDDLQVMYASAPPEIAAAALHSVADYDIEDRLHQVSIPAVVVIGTHDWLVAPSHSRRLAELLPDSQLEEVAGAGHAVVIERPDAVAHAIRRVTVSSAV